MPRQPLEHPVEAAVERPDVRIGPQAVEEGRPRADVGQVEQEGHEDTGGERPGAAQPEERRERGEGSELHRPA